MIILLGDDVTINKLCLLNRSAMVTLKASFGDVACEISHVRHVARALVKAGDSVTEILV